MKKNRKIDLFDIIFAIICLALLVFLMFDARRHVTQPEEPTEELRIVGEIYTASPVIVDVGTGLSVQDRWELTQEDIAEIEYYDSLDLLAICVEAEAGNQDLMGKCLVVDVVLNRVDSDRFPDDITSVITQPWQFSSWEDGRMDKVWSPSEETYQAVRMELESRTDSEVLFFTEGRYNEYCIPMYIHGDHYFGR